MYDSICIPTDGSAIAKHAARYGISLAQEFDSTVQVVSVIDERLFAHQFGRPEAAAGAYRSEIETQSTDAVAEIETMAMAAGIDTTTDTVAGVPHAVIPAYVTEHDADLIAMGTHGRTGFDRLLLGSVAERVIRTTTVPVLTTGETTDTNADYDDVLVPTDGSKPAMNAVEHGMAIASRTNSRLHVLSVVNLPGISSGLDEESSILDLTEQLSDETEGIVLEIADRGRERGLDVETVIENGTPEEEIVDYATQTNIDLIVMGTRGRTGLQRYLLGSTAANVVRHSPSPVMTIASDD
ncbi:universal stress protein [Halocatena halophila]|uniref:universal stress protein n=1 Tax=Halocatena halophila TaxID=2814576 RepID=UPI002ED0E911